MFFNHAIVELESAGGPDRAYFLELAKSPIYSAYALWMLIPDTTTFNPYTDHHIVGSWRTFLNDIQPSEQDIAEFGLNPTAYFLEIAIAARDAASRDLASPPGGCP